MDMDAHHFNRHVCFLGGYQNQSDQDDKEERARRNLNSIIQQVLVFQGYSGWQIVRNILWHLHLHSHTSSDSKHSTTLREGFENIVGACACGWSKPEKILGTTSLDKSGLSSFRDHNILQYTSAY